MFTDAPTCVIESDDSKTRTQGAAMGRFTSLLCQVDAKPFQEVRFEWSHISTSGDIARLSDALFSIDQENPLISKLSFTPEDVNDFGTYVCSASNSIGTQEKPCKISLVTAGPPEPPGNCSSSPVRTGVNISCSGGFHGGFPQTFFLQAWQKKRLIANLTR